ncbi:hypothetical protein [Pelomicrobium methylotrophicum]|uniref:Uncharacterized protein n=1 Tax=Pelomicrobium methylotrophicum TaxID=2602750 RepID=A0A5C7ENK5_9PROT|nr:hypothetical protein [Pelomicrobium methylotrophicum]TXF13311.1 hypothetical protein FR698_01875 [Pelomicrobium methylotrophicum]
MTFAELLIYLDTHTPYSLLDGTPEETVAKARTGAHRDPVAGSIIARLFEGSGVQTTEDPLARAQAVAALGPLRLAYMKDDAPVEGFRMVEKIVHAIDRAFDEEALRLKGKA